MKEEEINIQIGEQLRAARKEIGIGQVEMAKSLNVSREHYNRIENDKTSPSFKMMIALAEKYNLSIDWLLFKRGYMHQLPDDHIFNYITNQDIELHSLIYKNLTTEERVQLLKILRDLLLFIKNKRV